VTDPDVVLAYRLMLATLNNDDDAYARTMEEVSSLDQADRVIAALVQQWGRALGMGRIATNLAETLVPLVNKRKVRRARVAMGDAVTTTVIADVVRELASQLDAPKDES
jgi:hypothetical protein